MNYVSVLLPLALVLFLCKFLAVNCRKFGLPQVLGYLVGGLLLGLIKFIPNQNIFNDNSNAGLGFLAKIGVILIMFSAGLETDLKQIKVTGFKAICITIAGVIIPMGLGFLVASLMLDGGIVNIKNNYLEALSYGCILTATSVSVTVATLKELGKLNTPMGTCITSAAILDDIIGVVVLSIVLGLDASSGLGGEVKDLSFFVDLFYSKCHIDLSIASILSIGLYFVIFIIVGILFSKLFSFLAKKYDHHRRIPIFSLAFCFAYAWFAEELFGVADITGAFLAGMLLSTNRDRNYIDHKADTFSTLIFTPVFFANIGINLEFGAIDPKFIFFGILFIICGLVGKFLGCGLTAKACGFSWKESLSVGVGMMVRAEVALVCVDKLKDVVNPQITTFVVILILISSLTAPIFLKQLNKNTEKEEAVVTNNNKMESSK